jgi:kynurenine formamidase
MDVTDQGIGAISVRKSTLPYRTVRNNLHAPRDKACASRGVSVKAAKWLADSCIKAKGIERKSLGPMSHCNKGAR